MTAALSPPGPLAVTALLAAREARMRLSSLWFWIVASAVCLMAWVYGAGFLAGFETESVLVTTDPLMALNILVILFLAVVLGLRLAAAMAWEREHRTLEVLLVAPAGWGAILAAKFLVEVIVLAVLVTIYGAYLLAAQPLGSGVIAPADLAGLALMPAFALPTMALGLWAGTALGSVRMATVAFLILLGLLAGYEIARSVLAAQPATEMSLTGLYLRHALDLAAPVVRTVSAAAPLARLVEGMVLQTPPDLSAAAAAGGLALATLVAAAITGRLRGAVR